MASVETTAGPIEASELGRTLVHEHIHFISEDVVFQFPHLYDHDRDFERAVESLRSVKERGIETVVDPAVMNLGRDARLNARVAEASGVNVVMATGIYTYGYRMLPPHFQTRDADYMADVFVHDIEEGIQGTDVKAAFLKCAMDEPGLSDDIEKVLRAAARAHLRTGKPIMAHSHPSSGAGLEEMRIFEEEGVDPAHVQIAHTGDSDDLDYIEKLLERGPFIGMDRFGIDLFLPGEQRIATVVELCKRGYADRMMLSQDVNAGAQDWYEEELVSQLAPKWKITLVLDEIIPAIKEAGVTDEQVDAMMVTAPRRWLAGE
jgi:phosphotriesterase-related protein